MSASVPLEVGITRSAHSAASGKRVLLAEPRGYCAGVDRAVETVEKALDKYGAPLYVRKEIVHNRHVVETLADRGVVFVDETDEVPKLPPDARLESLDERLDRLQQAEAKRTRGARPAPW